MKKILILLLGLLPWCTGFSQPCGHDGIGFYSQEEIDRFQDLYPGCRHIQGDVIISGSDIYNLAGLSGVTAIDGYFEIVHTELLGTLEGLDSLRYIGGHFGIYSNLSLFTVSNLGRLDTVKGNFEVFGNPVLMNLKGMDSLKHVGQNLWIGSNISLDGLLGLKRLNSVGGLLQINDNPKLASIESLHELKRIGGDVLISSNPLLTSLHGLDSINAGTISGLYIERNVNLFLCSVYSICRYLELQYTTISILGNAAGCMNRAEVQAGCDTSAVETLEAGPLFSIYPNPGSGKIRIDIRENSPKFDLQILDLTGKVTHSQSISMPVTIVDIGNLRSGVYAVRLQNANRIEVMKLIKQ